MYNLIRSQKNIFNCESSLERQIKKNDDSKRSKKQTRPMTECDKIEHVILVVSFI